MLVNRRSRVLVDQYTWPLHIACEKGYDSLVKLLLDAGANPKEASGNGVTPLGLVCILGKQVVVKLLLERLSKEDLDVIIPVDRGTALHLACQNGHPEIVALLVEHGADLGVKNNIGETPLHVAAKEVPEPEGDINYACQHDDVVKLLLERGSSITAVDDLGLKPIDLVRKSGNVSVVDLLESAEQSPSFCGEPKMFSRSEVRMDDEPWSCEVPSGDSVEKSFLGNKRFVCTTIPEVSIQGEDECASIHDELLKREFPLVALARERNSNVLHMAAMGGYEDLVRRSIGFCDPCSKDGIGYTALHYAVARGSVSIAQFLLNRGAGKVKHEPSNGGVTPQMLAEVSGNPALLNLFM